MKSTLPVILGALILGGSLDAAPKIMPNPDFTKGEKIPRDAVKDWTLGATGLRGWMHSERETTVQARQVAVTVVAPGSPAAGILEVGDVILGVAGKKFSYDPRIEIGKALTTAEATDGKLAVTRWRAGKTEEVTLQLAVLGSYSATAPYDCEKSEEILERSARMLALRMADPQYKQNPIPRALNALGLLATGDQRYYPLIKREAEWAAGYDEQGFAVWYYGYITLFLAEYVMATGDQSVLPGLRRMAVEASKGQSKVGSWGHRFAGPDGRLLGYGMMNSPGLVMTIGLVLAREAGVDDPEVTTAIERSDTLLKFYIGKGSVPYGDHAPYMAGHEDNGKCGMAAVLFDQIGNSEGTRFFANMSTASHIYERDTGHTGNYFNLTWAMPGVARNGPHATGAWMEEFGAWYFDLARDWLGYFAHQGPPKGNNDSYSSWDATGAYLIAYAMPRQAIRLTGKHPSSAPLLDPKSASAIVADGRISDPFDRSKTYDSLSLEGLLERLSSWSPIIRDRAGKAYAKRKELPVEPLTQLLEGPSLDARLGACEALAAMGERAQPAVPKLIGCLKVDDLWLRIKAGEALAMIGQPAMEAVPALLEVVAKGPGAKDPRGMEQRYISQALFNQRNGMLKHSLDGVDQDLLQAAVRSGLRNEDGRTRGAFASVYANLSYEQIKPLLPAIHEAILNKSPSGIMFDGQIQNAGLDVFSRYHISEGIELIADYVRLQKKHGSEKNIDKLLEMIERYGAHAQRGIPLLEKAVRYFEIEEDDYPKDMSIKKAEKTRESIRRIKAMTEKPELRELGF